MKPPRNAVVPFPVSSSLLPAPFPHWFPAYLFRIEATGDGRGGEAAGGEGELEVVAAGGAGEIEYFAGEEEIFADSGFEGAGIDFGKFDAAGGDHGLLEAT